MNKPILAYGFGYESTEILKNLLKHEIDFDVVVCLGKEDTICKEAIKIFGKSINKKIKIIKTEFRDILCKIEGENIYYIENPIIKKFPNRTVIIGRKRRDFKDREIICPFKIPKKIKIKNILLPFWNGKLKFTKKELKQLK